MPVWKTKSGEVLEISQMEDSHIVNAINYVKRKVVNDVSTLIQETQACLKYAEQDLLTTNIVLTINIIFGQAAEKIKYLILEANKRKLKGID